MRLGVFVVALVVVWLLLKTLFPANLAGVALIPAALISFGALSLLEKFVKLKVSPVRLQPLIAVLVLGVGLVAAGIFTLSSLGGLLGQPAAVVQPVSPQAASPVTAAGVSNSVACLNSVAPDIRGTSATLTINAEDHASDNPSGTTVDVNQTFVFNADSIDLAGSGNQIGGTITDTTANAQTGFTAGQYVVMAGGSALGTSGYYMLPETKCIAAQQDSLRPRAYAWSSSATGGLDTTVYDDTGTTELGAGAQLTDYTRAMGANEEQLFFSKVKNQRVNSAYWLCGYGFATGFNISWVKPRDVGSEFNANPVTPLYAKDVTINTNNETTNSVTRSYSVYKLNNPRLLLEFQDYKFPFVIRSSSTDPGGNVNTTSFNGVFGLAIDCNWIRGQDGKMHFDLHDHTTSEANVGLPETLTSPSGGDVGFALVIT